MTLSGSWMDHHIETFPNGWIELSDASGSPFFIGAENCKTMSIRSIRHMLRDKPYAERVYDNNYRGDFVAQVKRKARGSRRRPSREPPARVPSRALRLVTAPLTRTLRSCLTDPA